MWTFRSNKYLQNIIFNLLARKNKSPWKWVLAICIGALNFEHIKISWLQYYNHGNLSCINRSKLSGFMRRGGCSAKFGTLLYPRGRRNPTYIIHNFIIQCWCCGEEPTGRIPKKQREISVFEGRLIGQFIFVTPFCSVPRGGISSASRGTRLGFPTRCMGRRTSTLGALRDLTQAYLENPRILSFFHKIVNFLLFANMKIL